jgi:hypothetical protein
MRRSQQDLSISLSAAGTKEKELPARRTPNADANVSSDARFWRYAEKFANFAVTIVPLLPTPFTTPITDTLTSNFKLSYLGITLLSALIT